MIEAHAMELITGSGFTGMTVVVGYFLRRRNEKIDAIDVKLDKMDKELKSDIKNNKAEIIQMFQDICHERQHACVGLQSEKMEGLRKEGQTICAKVKRIKEDRTEKWKKQETINDRVKDHIAKDK